VAVAAVCGVLLLVPAVNAWAHHSFASEYDADRPAKLQGTVKKIEWINPHSWITIDVKGADGTVQTWEIEAGAPNAMFRRGFNKDSLPLGTEIVVTMSFLAEGIGVCGASTRILREKASWRLDLRSQWQRILI